MHDDHGQPLNRLYNQKRLNDRAIDELIGISRGITADGKVNTDEAKFLKSWMEANIALSQDPLVNHLYRRIQEMLIDGVFDNSERKELFEILNEFTGESTINHPEMLTPSLPLCDPPPEVEFDGTRFCLTGKFAYGPRRICAEAIVDRNSVVADSMSNLVDYLVIGTFCSRDWVHTSYGRKIEQAVELRKTRGNISIISEDHWARAVFNTANDEF